MHTEEKIIYKVADFKQLTPVKYNVLKGEYEAQNRFHKLQKGMQYSRFNIRSIILLKTKKGEEKIKTPILKLDEKSVLIRGNVRIPIKSILSVAYEF